MLEQAQIIDAEMALALHGDACRDHALVGWVVWKEHSSHPEHPFIVQLATGATLPMGRMNGAERRDPEPQRAGD